ncbi:MAG: hypothetical protein ACJ8AY_14865 [Gemmatimonadales bacterium]
MLYLLVLGVGVSLALLALRVTRRRGAPQRSLSATALHAAALIVLIRLSLFGAGLALITGHADWRQITGYALLTLNAVGELAVAAALSNGRPGPAVGGWVDFHDQPWVGFRVGVAAISSARCGSSVTSACSWRALQSKERWN